MADIVEATAWWNRLTGSEQRTYICLMYDTLEVASKGALDDGGD